MKTERGFTLIELLLYTGIAAAILLSVSILYSILLTSRIKNQTIAEVEQQGVQVMQIVTQLLRNAESIDNPNQGSSASTLEIQTPTGSVEFEVDNNALVMKEGAGPLAARFSLNNSRVVISGTSFTNLSRSNTPGTIRIQFTLTHVNPAGRNEYSFTKTFIGSATLRQP